MIEPIADYEIQVKDNNRWLRYIVTWKEFVDMYIEDAHDRGYKEVRVVRKKGRRF